MCLAIRISRNFMFAMCGVGCGSTLPTGPAPSSGYDYTPVKYEAKVANLPTSEVRVEDTTIVEGSSPVSMKSPLKCKGGEILTFRGKVVGLTEADTPQIIAAECTGQTPRGPTITASGYFICKLEEGSIHYSVDLPCPRIAGTHKLTIKAVRVRKADGSFVSQDGGTTSILAEGTVEVFGDAENAPNVLPNPDPSFSREKTTNPTK